MSTHQGFALPDVGEGLTEAEILRWHVRPGDVVEVYQPLVEIETAKASVELPSPYAGTVVDLHVEPGAIVPVGTVIITLATPERADAPERQAVLVGYGVREEAAVGRRARRSAPPASPNGQPDRQVSRTVLAKPPVRHLARELGVDLATVTPTGPHGEVTRADILGAGGPSSPASPSSRPATPAPTITPVPGERVPVRGVQRAMAEAIGRGMFAAITVQIGVPDKESVWCIS